MPPIPLDKRAKEGYLPLTAPDAGPGPKLSLKLRAKLALCSAALSLFIFVSLSSWSVPEAVYAVWQPNMDVRCDKTTLSNSRCQNSRMYAEQLLSKHPLIDGHVDVPALARYFYYNKLDEIPFDQPAFANGSYPTKGHVDIPRLRAGKSGGFFWSAFVECPDSAAVGKDFEHAGSQPAVRNTVEQLDVIKQMIDKYHKDFRLVSDVKSARKAFKDGKLISFIGIEGGHSLGNSLFALRAFASIFSTSFGPVRYLTLTHTCHNAFADSAGEHPPRWNGLSPFARHLVYELNRLTIVPDISHVSDDAALQTIDMTRGPVMLSHSSARALKDIERNVPDSVLNKLAASKKDHIVMINFYPGFIGGTEDLDQVVKHVEHVSSIVGRGHVGVGTDFDGIMSVPKGLEDVSHYPDLVAKLVEKGWTDRELIGFVGENVLRVLADAERVALKMRKDGAQPDNTSWKDVFRSSTDGA
ncbi:related to Microsomal dipeptidase precursor [Ustilago bromivora]|uniref:Dipeptidase n=1 Tax=Ustilago bromivora TaxID=307758 RepID=A0A1K0HB22_9BASI|nr:related to Microsomal dipeptidase precursor [Ustilago bromivora]SYW80605.1 related to Microsomal dipeptidase precursor [Ustilago bromivora]